MRLIDPLTIEEVKALLAAPDGRTYGGLRDRAMLHMAYACGLRASELLAIQMNAFPPGSLATVRIHGKGRRERVLPLWRETQQALRRWIRSEEHTSELQSLMRISYAVFCLKKKKKNNKNNEHR